MIIDGKKIAVKEKKLIKEAIEEIKLKNKRVPKLVVVIVGKDPASEIYVNSKEKACEAVGMDSLIYRLEENTTQIALLNLIDTLNNNDSVDGILVQLPLPKQIDENEVIEKINPKKDVDGFHKDNVSRLTLNQEGIHPCTPEGIMTLFKYMNYDLKGKDVVVVGRSDIVGKPIAILCLHQDATVTITHSKTTNLKEKTSKADILIVAIGKPKFIDDTYVKEGAFVVDVGVNRLENRKICGDVDFDKVKDKVSYITPVPGGVGPMTIAMLLKNTLKAYNRRMSKDEQ